LEEWLKEFADDFDTHCEGCKVENIVQDEAFISASVQIARIVVSTHQREKLDYLRNALLNIAVGRGVGEVKQQVFLNAIEAFTPAHVKILNLIWRSLNPGWDKHSVPLNLRTYSKAIELLVPELNGQPAVIEAVVADLRNRGLTLMSNADISFPQGGLMTNLTAEFLRFVLNPQDLP